MQLTRELEKRVAFVLVQKHCTLVRLSQPTAATASPRQFDTQGEYPLKLGKFALLVPLVVDVALALPLPLPLLVPLGVTVLVPVTELVLVLVVVSERPSGGGVRN